MKKPIVVRLSKEDLESLSREDLEKYDGELWAESQRATALIRYRKTI